MHHNYIGNAVIGIVSASGEILGYKQDLFWQELAVERRGSRIYPLFEEGFDEIIIENLVFALNNWLFDKRVRRKLGNGFEVVAFSAEREGGEEGKRYLIKKDAAGIYRLS